jgi:hypothetical protein
LTVTEEVAIMDLSIVGKTPARALMQILEDGVSSSDFRPENVKMAVLGLLGRVNWTSQWFSPDGPLLSPETAVVRIDLAQHGPTERDP